MIRQWVIKEFNISMSHRGIAYVLHRLNLSYTRPTYVLAKADKEKQEKFKNDFEVLKKCLNGSVDIILSKLVRFAAFIYKFKVRTDKFLKTNNFLSFW